MLNSSSYSLLFSRIISVSIACFMCFMLLMFFISTLPVVVLVPLRRNERFTSNLSLIVTDVCSYIRLNQNSIVYLPKCISPLQISAYLKILWISFAYSTASSLLCISGSETISIRAIPALLWSNKRDSC